MANSIRKRVLICLSGSTSAYKIADLVSSLVKRDIEVRCLMTRSAREFITPLTLESLSGHPVLEDLWNPETGRPSAGGIEHIDLARWPDLILCAPASAHLIARMSLGLCDDLVTTVLLATRAPIWIAPAMNTAMLEHPATQEHLSRLRDRGVRILEPAHGRLACGEIGAGKLAPIEEIEKALIAALLGSSPVAQSSGSPVSDANRSSALPWAGKTVLITGGPTRAPIDAVRYITNPSTGKMGAALVENALKRGARVIYVLGKDRGVVEPQAPHGLESNLEIHRVQTAAEMLEAASLKLESADLMIASAAVSDYEIAEPSRLKLKRASEPTELKLAPSPDVLMGLKKLSSSIPNSHPQVWIGFAAETDDWIERARLKLERKGLDAIFVNPIAPLGSELESGFGGDHNSGWWLEKNRRDPSAESSSASVSTEAWSLKSKHEIASRILDRAQALLQSRQDLTTYAQVKSQTAPVSPDPLDAHL